MHACRQQLAQKHGEHQALLQASARLSQTHADDVRVLNSSMDALQRQLQHCKLECGETEQARCWLAQRLNRSAASVEEQQDYARLVVAWSGLRLDCCQGKARRQYIAAVVSQLETALCVRVLACWKQWCLNERAGELLCRQHAVRVQRAQVTSRLNAWRAVAQAHRATVRLLARRTCWRERMQGSTAFRSWSLWQVSKRTRRQLRCRVLGVAPPVDVQDKRIMYEAGAQRYLHRLVGRAVHQWHEGMHEEMLHAMTSTCEEMAQQLDHLHQDEHEKSKHMAILMRTALARMVRQHLSKAWASFAAAVAAARQQRDTVVRAALRIWILRLGMAFRRWLAQVGTSALEEAAAAREDLLADALSSLQSQRVLRTECAQHAVLRMLRAHLSASFDRFLHNVRISRQGRKRKENVLVRARLAQLAAAFNQFVRLILEQCDRRGTVEAALSQGLRQTCSGRALDTWRNAMLHAQQSVRTHQVAHLVRQRWLNRRLSEAWARWCDEHARAGTAHTVVARAALRWSKGTQARVLASLHLSARTSKTLRTKAYKIVARWRGMMYAAAWTTWRAVVRARRKLRTASSRVIARWAHVRVARAWHRWHEQIRRSRVACQIVTRWVVKAMWAAWSRWEEYAGEVKREARVLGKVLQRWRRRELQRGWEVWYEQHVAAARVWGLLTRAERRVGHARLTWGLGEWRDGHRRSLHARAIEEEKRRRMAQARGMVVRMVHGHLAWAFELLCTQILRTHRERAVCERVIARMQDGRRARAFDAFVEATGSAKQQRAALGRVIARWRGGVTDRALQAWWTCVREAREEAQRQVERDAAEMLQREWREANARAEAGVAREVERRRALCQQVVARILQAQLAAAWARMIAVVQASQQQRARCRRAVLRMTRCGLAMALQLWRARVEEGQERRLAVGRAVGCWRSQAVARAWAAWGEYMEVAEAERQEAARQAMTEHELAEIHNATQVERRRRLDLAWRLVRRMGKRDLATAVGRWSAGVQVSKAVRYRLGRAVRRVRSTAYAAVWRCWMHHLECARGARAATAKGLTRCAHHNLVSAWSLWCERVGEGRVAGRVAERATRQGLGRVCSMWHAHVAHARRLRQAAGLVWRRCLRQRKGLALEGWYSEQARRAQAVRLAQRVFLRWSSHYLGAVVGAWRCHVLLDKKKRTSMTRIILKMLSRAASSALLSWQANARVLTKQRNMSRKIVLRLHGRCLAKAFDSLASFALSRTTPPSGECELACACLRWQARMMAMVGSQSCSITFMQWFAHVQGQRQQRQHAAKEDLHEQTLESKQVEILELQEAIEERDAAVQMLPHLVQVHLDLDYATTLCSSDRTATFNHALEKAVGVALGVSTCCVGVLGHQRGSIIAQVVLSHQPHNASHVVPMSSSDLARELVSQVHAKEKSKLKATALGSRCCRAQVIGTLAVPVYQMMKKASESSLSSRRLSEAWARWCDEHARAGTAHTVVARAALRWSKGTQARVLASLHLSARTSKTLRTKAYKIVARWRGMMYAAAWTTWRAVVRARRKLRTASSRVIARWAHVRVARAWHRWHEQIRRSRVACQIVTRWVVKAMWAAWSRWEEYAGEVKREARVLGKVLQRWRRRELQRGWEVWYEQHVAAARVWGLLTRAERRVGHARLTWGLGEWRDGHRRSLHARAIEEEKRRRMAQARGMVVRMVHGHLAWAFELLCTQILRTHRERAVCERVIARMQDGRRARAFDAFVEATGSAKQQRAALGRVIARWRGGVTDRALQAWWTCVREAREEAQRQVERDAAEMLQREWREANARAEAGVAREVERRRALCQQVVARILQAQLAAAWARMIAVVQASQQQRARCRRAVLRMTRCGLAMALQLWRARVEEGQERRLAVGRAVGCWRSQAVARAWAAWGEYMEVAEAERQEAARQAMTEHELAEIHNATQVERRRRLDLAWRLVRRMGKRDLATAVGRWSAGVQVSKAVRYRLGRAVRRVRSTAYAAVWRCWMHHLECARGARAATAKGLTRCAHHNLVSAWSLWCERVGEGRVAGRVAERATRQGLGRVCSMWHAHVAHARRLRQAAGLVWRRCLRQRKGLALEGWYSEQARRAQAVRLAQRVGRHWVRRSLCLAFDVWLACIILSAQDAQLRLRAFACWCDDVEKEKSERRRVGAEAASAQGRLQVEELSRKLSGEECAAAQLRSSLAAASSKNVALVGTLVGACRVCAQGLLPLRVCSCVLRASCSILAAYRDLVLHLSSQECVSIM